MMYHFADANCETLKVARQALSSLPSTLEKGHVKRQIEDLSDVKTSEEKCMELHVPSTNRQVPVSPVLVGHDSTEHLAVTVQTNSSTSTPILASTFKSRTLEQLPEFIQNIGEENLPLISNDVAIQLLKIQSSM